MSRLGLCSLQLVNRCEKSHKECSASHILSFETLKFLSTAAGNNLRVYIHIRHLTIARERTTSSYTVSETTLSLPGWKNIGPEQSGTSPQLAGASSPLGSAVQEVSAQGSKQYSTT